MSVLVFTDIHDREIFSLKKKHFAIHKTFHAESPKGHDLFVITKKFTVLTNESTVSFQNESDGRKVELDVRGTWYDRSASVTFGGEPVAHISRSIFNMREIFADKDTYFVTVAPGVDLTMIAALCVSLDEEEEKK
ncbi:tubby C-terminal-like domain-containing protein [Usnea florida]